MAKGGSDPESTVSKPCTVFIDTNLNTHLAMIVSDEDTIRELKQKIMSEHTHCFPKIGEITIQAMKVRRKACFYHLSDSMLVKCAFNGVNRTWVLYVDAASSQLVPTENRLFSEPGSSSLPNCFHIADGPSAETEKNNIQFDHQSKMISTLAHEGQFIPGDHMVGDVSAGSDLGRKSFSLEHNTTSGANKRTVSGKRKQHGPVSNENEVSGTHTEQKKDESGKIRDMQFDDILEEAPQLEPARKNQRKEKTYEDDFSYSVRDPSKGTDAGNVDADSLLAMEKDENNGNKVGSEANVPGQGVPSGGSKANRVKKHMIGSAKGLNPPLVGESVNPNGDITPLISDAGVPDDDNIGTVPNDKTEVKEKALPPNGDPELVSSSVPNEAEMNIKGGVVSPSDTIKMGNLSEKRKRRSKKTTKVSVAPKNISGVKHVNEEADPLKSKSDEAFHGDHSGHETKTNDDNLARVEKEGLLRIKDGGLGDDNIDTDQIDTAEKEEKGGDPKLMSSKGTGMNHKSTVRSEKEMSDTDMMVSSKLLDASGLVKARVRGDKGKKLKKTKTSNATIGVSTSGVENGLSERDVIPVRSELDKAFDSGHPGIESKKEGIILSQTGKSRTSKMESVNAPSLGLEKEADKGSENEDHSLQLTQITHFQETADYRDEKVKLKSVKTKYSTSKSNPDPPKELKVAHSGDLTPSNDENKKEENAPSKKVKKSRLGKPTLVNKLSESLPEVEKDRAVVTEPSQYQNSRNNGSSEIPSDTLQHNVVRRPLEEYYKEDDYLVNGCTDEDNSHLEAPNADDDELDFSEYFVPEPDHHEVAPAKGFVDQDAEIRASDEKLKALHPKKKDKKLKANKHSVCPMPDGHEIQIQGNKKKPDGGVSKTVQGSLSKAEQNKPAPQPEVEAFPHKVSRKNTVNAANASPVHAHRTRSSNMASSVDKVDKNEKKGRGNLQSRKDQYNIAVKRSSGNKMGEVLNNSKREKSLLATSNTIFEDGGTESSQDEGEANNSEDGIRSPSDDTNLDSPGNVVLAGSYGGKGKDNNGNDVTMSQRSKKTLDMVLRSSSNYKKAKLRVSESQLEDTENQPEIVLDSQI